MAGALGGDHGNVDAFGGFNVAEDDVKAVGEEEGVAVLQVGQDLLLVDLSLNLVGGQNHDDVSFSYSLSNGHDL